MKLSNLLLFFFVDWLVPSISNASPVASQQHTLAPLDNKFLKAAAAAHTEEDSSLALGEETAAFVYGEDSSPANVREVVNGTNFLQLAAATPTRVGQASPQKPHSEETAAELTGVKENHHGHISTFTIACLINLSVVFVCMLVFSSLRLRYPLIYSGNVVQKVVPLMPEDTFLGWFRASVSVSTEVAAEHVGLDAALSLEFCNIACKILTMIGVPMVCIMCPLHYYVGGRGVTIYELSSIDMGNVIFSHPWLYYLHACIVNLVTILVTRVVYSSMPNFLRLRYAWLKNMPAPRSTTVLVEGIPEGWRSDAKLREFFETMFKSEEIMDCYVTKDAQGLLQVYNETMQCEEKLKGFKDKWKAAGSSQEDRPMTREKMCLGKEVDAIDYLEGRLAELRPQVEAERIQAIKDAKQEGSMNCESGFVTFARRREAEVCHNIMAFSSQRDEWIVSVPPPVSDVRWNDLKQPESRNRVSTAIGYSLTAMLFVCFIPIVVVGTNLSEAVKVPIFQNLWDSFAPGLALMLFLAFLPTILLLIFSSFFALKSETFAQHKLQIWYFIFMLFFVILVTLIGKSLVQTFAEVLQTPALGFEIMAKQMPKATQFYMDFLMLQWGEQAMNFMRMVPLAKFLLFTYFFKYEDEDAKRMAEPEDQDFYGIGSRSARFTINLLIGIIFCTLSPLTTIMALILFVLMRIFYGYLVVFAETKKPDLGGVFFNTQLQHILLGISIYNILMISVLCFRARTKIPMFIAMPSIAYAVWSYFHFSQNFVWKELPFTEVCRSPGESTPRDSTRYIQPEFVVLSFGKRVGLALGMRQSVVSKVLA